MKIFLLLLITNIVISASSINKSILEVHATILPKIFLLEYNYKKLIKNDSITITILHDNSDYKNALYLKDTIDKKYLQLNSYPLEIILTSYNDLINASKATNILYMLPSKTDNIIKAIKIAKTYKALTFSYKNSDLKNDVMISISNKIKTKPILNLNAIKNSRISFKPILLSISEIYNKDTN